MKIIIIGGVAAGTSVGAKARRNNESANITIYDKDTDISYGVCGIPYTINDEVENFDQLTPRDSKWFKKRYNIDIKTSHEVTKIDHDKKTVYVKNLETNEEFEDTYDNLVFANGSVFNTPPALSNLSYKNLFRVKNIQRGKELKKYLMDRRPEKAIVVGSGYIGLEVAEQLKLAGLDVKVIDILDAPMSQLDMDMGSRIIDILEENGVEFIGGEGVVELIGDDYVKKVVTSKDNEFETDLLVVATGIEPNVKLAESIHVHIGKTGAIAVNDKLETNLPGVYAVGDVAESHHAITNKPMYVPLATTANKMGRIAGDAMTGGDLRFQGVLGTSILRLFDQTVASTGLTEKAVREELGIIPTVLMNVKPNKPTYMGGKDMVIKAVADPKTEKLLGVQIIGPEGVDKRIDVFVTAITLNASVSDLFHLDLAYAPPFSTTKDPVAYTGMALTNAFKQAPLITVEELEEFRRLNKEFNLIDVRSEKQFNESHIEGAVNIPLSDIRVKIKEFDRNKPTIVYCNSGTSGNAAQNILIQNGFTDVYNLSGGNKNYQSVR